MLELLCGGRERLGTRLTWSTVLNIHVYMCVHGAGGWLILFVRDCDTTYMYTVGK